MKSLIYTELGKVQEGDTPKPEEDVLIRVAASGICGTDVKAVFKGHRYFKPPTVLGHEFYGQISKAPEGYRYPVGTWVVAAPYFECGKCSWCRSGNPDLCESKHYVTGGSFAEYVGIPEGYEEGLFQLPDSGNRDVFALTEPLACVMNGIERLKITPLYSRVLVVGGGPMGALFAFSLGQRGIDVSIVEPSEERASILRRWGIDVRQQSEVKAGEYDNIVIAVNKGALLSAYMPLLRQGGTMLLFAGLPSNEILSIDAGAIHYGEVCLTGCSGFHLNNFKDAFETISADTSRYARLITCRMGFKDGQKAFDMLSHAQAFKILLGSSF
jgi:L-iditol 2-dehydrogenase